MDTSIYIKNDRIEVIRGEVKKSKIRIEYFATEKLERGSILNGIILNKDEFVRALEAIKTKCKEGDLRQVRILFGGDSGLLKTRRIPRLRSNDMRKWLQSEFEDSKDIGEDLVCDYSILAYNKNEGDFALLSALPKKEIKEYVDVFDEVDISISSMDIWVSSQIKAIDLIDETIGKNFITLMLDGDNVHSSLYIDGIFNLNNSVRLLADIGTDERVEEIIQLISRVIQFNYAEKNDKEVSGIYFSGFQNDKYTIDKVRESEYSFPILSIAETVKENIEAPKDLDLEEYLYAVFNLVKE